MASSAQGQPIYGNLFATYTACFQNYLQLIIIFILISEIQVYHMQVHSSATLSSPTPSNFDFLFIVRLIFYIMVGLKLIEIAYLRKRKMNLKQRIYRKFIFAHNEVIKTFSEDEKVTMESTLSNTLRNANMALPTIKNDRKSKNSKRVLFATQSNEYFQPVREQQQNSKEAKAERTLAEQVKDEDFKNQPEEQIGQGEEKPLLDC